MIQHDFLFINQRFFRSESPAIKLMRALKCNSTWIYWIFLFFIMMMMCGLQQVEKFSHLHLEIINKCKKNVSCKFNCTIQLKHDSLNIEYIFIRRKFVGEFTKKNCKINFFVIHENLNFFYFILSHSAAHTKS